MDLIRIAGRVSAQWEERIPGGLAEGKGPEDFDPGALAEGAKVEMEHTGDPGIAEEIAMDHLTEDPNYYEKLKAIEGDGEPADYSGDALP